MPNMFDVSMPIHLEMQVYKNKAEKRPSFEVTSDFTTGSVRETRVHLDVHTGTHVDAPLHMLPGGGTIDQISLSHLIRSCRVYDLTHVQDAIHKADIEQLAIPRGEFALFKTKNSFEDTFNFEFVYVAEDAAEALAAAGVAGVGVDGLGVERGQAGHPTHKTLFAAGCTIIEGLRLKEVPAGQYQLVALPLPLVGLDASPARIILVDSL